MCTLYACCSLGTCNNTNSDKTKQNCIIANIQQTFEG